jgi:predicted nucleic acid-binding protein
LTLLDTSAILVHAYKEPGWETVEECLLNGKGWVASVTWFELRIALRRRSAPELFDIYWDSVTGTVDVSAVIAEAAFNLRVGSGARLPAMDSLVAGTAQVKGFRLLHRDQHLAQIPQALLAQVHLPAQL